MQGKMQGPEYRQSTRISTLHQCTQKINQAALGMYLVRTRQPISPRPPRCISHAQTPLARMTVYPRAYLLPRLRTLVVSAYLHVTCTVVIVDEGLLPSHRLASRASTAAHFSARHVLGGTCGLRRCQRLRPTRRRPGAWRVHAQGSITGHHSTSPVPCVTLYA